MHFKNSYRPECIKGAHSKNWCHFRVFMCDWSRYWKSQVTWHEWQKCNQELKRVQIFIECSAVTKKNVDTLFKEICKTIQAASLQTPNTTCFGARKSLRDLSNQKAQQSMKKSTSKMSKLKVTKSPNSPKTPRTPNRRLPLRLQQFRKQKLASLFWYFRFEI